MGDRGKEERVGKWVRKVVRKRGEKGGQDRLEGD